jgi:four helix bundle protein
MQESGQKIPFLIYFSIILKLFNQMKHNFKKLLIWQKAMDLTDHTFIYWKEMPADEKFNLINQINRCSCSISSNIAEGSEKRTSIHFAEYLTTSLTSFYELETQLLICARRQYGDDKFLQKTLRLVTEIQKMIFSFREKILQSKY